MLCVPTGGGHGFMSILGHQALERSEYTGGPSGPQGHVWHKKPEPPIGILAGHSNSSRSGREYQHVYLVASKIYVPSLRF